MLFKRNNKKTVNILDDIIVPQISADELKSRIENGDAPVMIDVRDAYELRSKRPGRVDGAINIPLGFLRDRLDDVRQYQDEEVVVICRTGAKSLSGARRLLAEGFTNVRMLAEGIKALQ